MTTPTTLIDCRQVIELSGMHHYNILGIVENMSGSRTGCCGETAHCSCGKSFEPFGKESDEKAEKLAKYFNIPFLGKIPLTDGNIHEAGTPTLNNIKNSILEAL